MSNTQNVYSSSNLYSFVTWASTSGSFAPLDPSEGQFANISEQAKKQIKRLFIDLPKELEEANKSSLGLTSGEIQNIFSASQSAFTLDKKYRQQLFDKVFNSGILDLVEEIGGLREFSRKRFSSIETLTGSADDGSATSINDPIDDVRWQDALIKVRNFFAREPITLALIYQYFPNLANLFLSALAATADYGYNEDDKLNDTRYIMEQMFKSFGTDKDTGEAIFEPVWETKDFLTVEKLQKAIEKMAIPSNVAPATPDIFHLRIGAANFYVPPVSISINTSFKTGSMTGGAIRQKSSPKFNAGYRETTINMRLYFPNYENIWGIDIDDGSKLSINSDFKIDFNDDADIQKVDKFLSSLRGLVAAFKYSPILPIKNHYLNSVHKITGVALNAMSISTIPDYPFALVVDIELLNFNHKPFLPMIKDFNQAVHWGKYRHFMGRAAGSMYNYISEEFISPSDAEEPSSKKVFGFNQIFAVGEEDDTSRPINVRQAEEIDAEKAAQKAGQIYDETTSILTTNVKKEWEDGKTIQLYIPSSVQSKVFTPDISSFRTSEEVARTDVGRGFWENLLSGFGLDVNESESYHRDLETVINTSRNNITSPPIKKKAETILKVVLARS